MRTGIPWYFQSSALHFRPSLQPNGPVLNGKVCVAFYSPVDTEMAFWAATLRSFRAVSNCCHPNEAKEMVFCFKILWW